MVNQIELYEEPIQAPVTVQMHILHPLQRFCSTWSGASNGAVSTGA